MERVSWKIPSFRSPGLGSCLQQSWSFSLPLIKSLSPIRGLIARDETESIHRPDSITNGGQAECQIAAAILFVPEMLTNCQCAPSTAFKASKSLHATPLLLFSLFEFSPIHQGRSPEISRRVSIAKPPKISSGFDEYTPVKLSARGDRKEEQRKARAFSPLETRFRDISLWGTTGPFWSSPISDFSESKIIV